MADTYRCRVLTCGEHFPSASAVRAHRHKEHPELVPQRTGVLGEIALEPPEVDTVKRLRAWGFALLRGDEQVLDLETVREFAEMPAAQQREIAVRVGTRILEMCEAPA